MRDDLCKARVEISDIKSDIEALREEFEELANRLREVPPVVSWSQAPPARENPFTRIAERWEKSVSFWEARSVNHESPIALDIALRAARDSQTYLLQTRELEKRWERLEVLDRSGP